MAADGDTFGHRPRYEDDEDHSQVTDIIHIMDQEIARFRGNNSEQGVGNSNSIELEPETEQPMEHRQTELSTRNSF